MRLNRRTFLFTAAGAVVAAGRPRAAEKLPLCFSTLGCPQWSWKQIVDGAVANGYAAVELRGLLGQMDLPTSPEFSPERVKEKRADLSAAGISIAGLGSSAQMHHADPAARKKNLDEARRFIDLAAALKAPYVRVFGDKVPEGEDKATVVKRVGDGLRELSSHARGSGVQVIIESHGDFPDSPTLLAIMKAAGEGPAILWDTHHTVVAGHEAPADTFRQIGKFVRHTHIKDSVPAGGDEVKYVLLGQGQVPIRQIVEALASGGYKGFYGFEWEKAWHPDIEAPEIAIPQYAKTMREYLKQAGVSAAII